MKDGYEHTLPIPVDSPVPLLSHSQRRRLVTILAFAAVYLIWGTTFLALKIAVTAMPPLVVIAIRFVSAGGFLVLLSYKSGMPWPQPRELVNAAISGTLLFLGGHGALAWGQRYVDSGLSALVISTVPLWMIVLERIGPDKRTPSRIEFLGLFLGLAGVFVLFGAPEKDSMETASHITGIIALVFSALMWAAGSLYARHQPMPRGTAMNGGLQMLLGGLIVTIIALITGQFQSLDVPSLDASAIIALLYLIIFGSLVAFTAYTWLLSTQSALLVSTYTYVNPLVAIFVGAIFANEIITVQIKMVVPLILLAVLFISLPKWRSRSPASPPALAQPQCHG